MELLLTLLGCLFAMPFVIFVYDYFFNKEEIQQPQPEGGGL